MTGVPASSHGGVTLPLVLTGTDPASGVLDVQGPAAGTQPVLSAADDVANGALRVQPLAAGGCVEVRALDPWDANGGPYLRVFSGAAVKHSDTWLAQFDGISGDVIIKEGGYLCISAHAAPADGDISTGELALWFDQTNGAAKLMVKAKQANGTVVTASVALA